VIEDRPEVEAKDLQAPEPDTEAASDPAPRRGGFHVRAVPIDQPVGDSVP
jgi:hypothetical protein